MVNRLTYDFLYLPRTALFSAVTGRGKGGALSGERNDVTGEFIFAMLQ